MGLLTTVIIILLTTASAKPIGSRRHHDADITDNDKIKGLLVGKNRWSWQSTEPSSYEDSSSGLDQSLESRESNESSKSQSSMESSEEVLITDQTTAVMTTAAMTTIITGDGSTLTPEAGTMSTDEPTITVTPPPTTPTTPVVITSPGSEIPTAAPVSENRGDN